MEIEMVGHKGILDMYGEETKDWEEAQVRYDQLSEN